MKIFRTEINYLFKVNVNIKLKLKRKWIQLYLMKSFISNVKQQLGKENESNFNSNLFGWFFNKCSNILILSDLFLDRSTV